MQALPADIRSLPTYVVSTQLYACTLILLFFFLLLAFLIWWVWIIRSCNNIHNFDYVPDHQFLVYYKNKEEKIKNEEGEEGHLQPSEDGTSSNYVKGAEQKYNSYNRNQSRFLEFACVSVMVAININAYASQILQVISYLIAAILFFLFNILRIKEDIRILRLLFLFALIAAWVPFYSEDKSLQTM